MHFPSWSGGKRPWIAIAVLAALLPILAATLVEPLLIIPWASTSGITFQESLASTGSRAAFLRKPRPLRDLDSLLSNPWGLPPKPGLNECTTEFSHQFYHATAASPPSDPDRETACHSQHSSSNHSLSCGRGILHWQCQCSAFSVIPRPIKIPRPPYTNSPPLVCLQPTTHTGAPSLSSFLLSLLVFRTQHTVGKLAACAKTHDRTTR